MTIKRSKQNLKWLFIGVGVLLALTFVLIQYSVQSTSQNGYVDHDITAEIATNTPDIDSDMLDAYETALEQLPKVQVEVSPQASERKKKEGGGGDLFANIPKFSSAFTQRLVLFSEPFDAPELNFQNILGREVNLNDFNGQWVVVNFWASWCPPCIVEMPSLQQLQDTYAEKNVNVIAISLDRNNTAEILSFGPVAGYFAHWPDIRETYEIKGLPTTYIINPQGQMVARFRGDAEWSGDEATSLLDYLMQRFSIPQE